MLMNSEGPRVCQNGAKMVSWELRGCQNQVLEGPGEVPGGPGELPGKSRCPGGARGRPQELWASILGSPWRAFWVPFRTNFWYVFSYFLQSISASFFDAVLELFGYLFGDVLETFCSPNFIMKSVTF